ncbi:MAG: hypothetical protein IPJ88_12405 [Myxococcales bacterium]|nr:MAG: hypothetical protein IPJ88_12405 [Myxococcales bacterium]
MDVATQTVKESAQRVLCNGSEQKTLRILAKSTLKELKEGGLSSKELVCFTTELLDLVGDDFAEAADGKLS